MLLLHISDIHFREPDCINPDLDPDRPYRTRMLQDVRQRVQATGTVGAMLIGGDVAFKGHPAEYAVARTWIYELAAACGCHPERIFVIPGNHDVDRGAITGSAAVRNAQAAIMAAAPPRREREFRAQFMDAETGRALFKPLAAYNEFAKYFSCQIYAPDHLYWKQDLPLRDGVHLRIHGLTSVLLSGAGGREDTRESLYLSPLQTTLDPVEDVVNLVLCHHPPDWFCDQDEVDEKITNRATLHLFGHKHRQRIAREDGYVRFSAGAVNPDRGENGWQPAYNLIDVSLDGEGASRALQIEAHLLQWQANPEQYRPVLTTQGEPVFRHRIGFPGRARPPAAAPVAASTAAPKAPADTDVEAAMSDEGTRNLVIRFWNLSASQRRDVALKLSLIGRDELQLPEPERYGRALLRAGERGVLNDVAREVAARETT